MDFERKSVFQTGDFIFIKSRVERVGLGIKVCYAIWGWELSIKFLFVKSELAGGRSQVTEFSQPRIYNGSTSAFNLFLNLLQTRVRQIQTIRN